MGLDNGRTRGRRQGSPQLTSPGSKRAASREQEMALQRLVRLRHVADAGGRSRQTERGRWHQTRNGHRVMNLLMCEIKMR